MTSFSRRRLLAVTAAAGAAVAFGGRARAQSHDHHGMFSHLNEPGLYGLPTEAPRQQVFSSPAPAAANPGRWIERKPLPLPRSEMAWATAWKDRMYLVGGYGEQRVSNTYNHIYVAAEDRWAGAPPMPRSGNHVGVVATDGILYAIGGHSEQNRDPYADCFAFEIETGNWRTIAPLPQPRGAISVVARDGLIHAIGGATGKTNEEKKSVAWHDVYDPKADAWTRRAPIPLGRDHMGAVLADGRIHVIAGRVDSARTNVGDHDVYLPAEDKWEKRAPLPTPRSGHGAVLYRGVIFCMGGEEFDIVRGADGRPQLAGKVFGQNEGYEVSSDTWHQYAPMPTPRHGLGAALVGDQIHVAGGGPVTGGRVQSAVHEAFTLG
ncbi:MAG: Kelch repeat-containing protein [Rhodospirillales bacterium]